MHDALMFAVGALCGLIVGYSYAIVRTLARWYKALRGAGPGAGK